MYLNIGGGELLPERRIIGVFDLGAGALIKLITG